MANGGGDLPISPRAQQPSGGGACSDSDTAWLPLDIIIAEIAARSDPATLVRCAATCRAARRRISEGANLRLRLRDAGLFLPSLLRGHLVGFTSYDDEWARLKTDVYLVDTTTAADATRVVEATFASDAAEAETLTDPVPVESRGGLVLLRATATRPHDTLLVCNLATGRRLVLPPETEPFQYGGGSFEEQYVLLVGDRDDNIGSGVGRPFQVLKVKLDLWSSNRRLMVQTFSSEHGSWSPRTAEIRTPNIHGRRVTVMPNILVVGDVVHWLCLTEVRSYVLRLHVTEARVSEMVLPATFRRYAITPGIRSHLLATTDSAGGSLVVLVADGEKNVRAWEQCNKHTHTKSKMWKAWPHVVIDREAILGFNNEMKEKDEVATRLTAESKLALELLCFGERSGVVLLRTHGCCLLWLDLHSKKIIRCFCSDRWMSYAKVYCSYELDLSSWAPTFSGDVTI